MEFGFYQIFPSPKSAILARHYGLTDEELDYIVNYDAKFRTDGE